MSETPWVEALRAYGLPEPVARVLRAQLGNPLLRNAYALMVNTGVTGVLGVAYWALAARLYSDRYVGEGSAAISAMMLIAGLAALNLTGALTRFLPRAGRATVRVIGLAYLGSGLVAAAAAGVFVLTLPLWGSSFDYLEAPAARLVFVAAVAAWTIFTAQDGVLTGLRSAAWVPVENAAYGVLKIGLLVALAAALPEHGVLASWVAPGIVCVVLVSVLIFVRLAPRHVRATHRVRESPPTVREMGRFLAGDYVGSLFAHVVVYLVPVLVAATFPPDVYAHFYIVWMIASVIDLLGLNMAMSLTVEGALDESTLARNCRAALRKTMLILAPVVVGGFLLAPVGLDLLGHQYGSGTTLLRVLLVGTIPRAVTEVYLGALRARNRPRLIAALQALRSVLTLGLAVPLMMWLGVVGVGWAALVGQGAVTVLALPGLHALATRRPTAAVGGER
jgi:O-antigen/teichoic acid export membrane protein